MRTIEAGLNNGYMRQARRAGVLASVRFDPSNGDAERRVIVLPERGVGSRYYEQAALVGATAMEPTEAGKKKIVEEELRARARQLAAEIATSEEVELEFPDEAQHELTDAEMLELQESELVNH